ncbi:hypothetical protein [Roseomonas sp. KE0001]|uniref:hypothetical protein n=1 Tax=Roseomonas sp. KE0001 TaxID=2479201 RepID=UPI0018DFA406|nr:hypothetical protein [Roseomonas sp. KE0001]MBI0436021.1 hypothetical protein [Roseomonas sp. KE0001]
MLLQISIQAGQPVQRLLMIGGKRQMRLRHTIRQQCFGCSGLAGSSQELGLDKLQRTASWPRRIRAQGRTMPTPCQQQSRLIGCCRMLAEQVAKLHTVVVTLLRKQAARELQQKLR